MKVRRARPKEPNRFGSPDAPRVTTIHFEGTTLLVTLDDPAAPLDRAKGAFARLKAPIDQSAAETAAWADLVRPLARAVRVVSSQRRRGIATPEDGPRTPVAGIREEATAIAATSGDEGVPALVESILSEVGG